MRDLHSCDKRMFVAIDLRQPSDEKSSAGISLESSLGLAMSLYNFEDYCEVYAISETLVNLKKHMIDRSVTLDKLKEKVEEVSFIVCV